MATTRRDAHQIWGAGPQYPGDAVGNFVSLNCGTLKAQHQLVAGDTMASVVNALAANAQTAGFFAITVLGSGTLSEGGTWAEFTIAITDADGDLSYVSTSADGKTVVSSGFTR